MNIRFKEIGIQNFRSIDKAVVQLSDQGIVIVKGINEYEDNASSNGSGKSSIFEAIVFSLFDETSSGEKDVANKISNNGYVVTLKFTVDDVEYIIERSQTGSKSTVILYKNGIDISARNKSDTNKLILNILGISKDIFLDSIFLSQNVNTNLASLSPSARRERLETITNTDILISNFKEQIKLKQAKYEQNCKDNDQLINKCIGKEEVINNQIVQYKDKIKQLEFEINKKKELGNITTIQEEINTLKTNLVSISTNITDVSTLLANINEEINQIRKQRLEVNDKYNELNNKLLEQTSVISEYDFKILNLKNKINNEENNIARIDNEIQTIRNSDTCPTCGRKYDNVNEDHIINLIKEKQYEINQINNEITSINTEIQKLQLDKNTEQHKVEDIKSNIDIVKQEITQFDNEIQSKNNTIIVKQKEKDDYYSKQASIQNKIDQLNNVIKEILKVENNNIDEYKNQITECNKELENISKEKQIYIKQKVKNEELLNTTKHILQLITKDFRNYLLQNSIQYLNKLLSQYSTKLFSNQSDVIRIESNDTKLNIKLNNSSYESLSGGEKTRVNIALLLAQKSLASYIGNISCNLIILDEILGYCDSVAESKVVDLILSELETLETIFMVSHKEISIPYDLQLTVIKNKQGLSSVFTY